MQFYLSIIYFLIFNIVNFINHESYISITEIKILENQKVHIHIELNAHDFEYVFKKETGSNINSIYTNNIESFKNLELASYILNHFSIKAGNNELKLDIIKNEINLDGNLHVFLEGKSKKKIKSLTVYNDLFVNWLLNQQNIVNLVDLKNSSFTFNKNQKSHVFK